MEMIRLDRVRKGCEARQTKGMGNHGDPCEVRSGSKSVIQAAGLGFRSKPDSDA